jgi:hypothetical protein
VVIKKSRTLFKTSLSVHLPEAHIKHGMFMPVIFMPQPDGYEYWQSTAQNQQRALQGFWNQNSLHDCDFQNGSIPGLHYRPSTFWAKSYTPFVNTDKSCIVCADEKTDEKSVYIEYQGKNILSITQGRSSSRMMNVISTRY